MENIESIKENAKNKSINGKSINYKTEAKRLEPQQLKKEILKFSVTAGLIISAISLTSNEQVREFVTNKIEAAKESYEEREYNKDVKKSLETLENSIVKTTEIPFDTQTKRYNTEDFYFNIAKNILNNGEFGYLHLDSYIKIYGYNSNEIQTIVDNMARLENTHYTDITNFLDLKLGIKTYEDFQKYCLDYYDKHHYQTEEERKAQEAMDKANEDLTTFWVREVQNSLDPDMKIYEFYNIYKNQDLVDELITKLGFSQGKDYVNLEQYLLEKGYASKEEWLNYYLEKANSNGRNI